MPLFYKTILSIVFVAIIWIPDMVRAQFRGGSNDGVSFNVASNQSLGRNIFSGGNEDGFKSITASNQSLGRNIFLGGVDDGFNFSVVLNQSFGRNIFKGGNDDGINGVLASNQLLGRNIFRGGNDDGTDVTLASGQALGRNIFTGGSDDGWAMASKANLPLPITLTDFNGRWQLNDALLFWKTTTESNSSHFELERSFDGFTFTNIQRIDAAGNSTSIKSYQYTDVNLRKLLPIGITSVYYRLRSVDKNGTASYSGVVLLKVSNTNEIEYAVFPNPAKDIVTITASQSPSVEDAYIRFADVSGRVLLLQKMISSRQQISVSAYPDGTYFLQLITTDKVVYTQKIIIRK